MTCKLFRYTLTLLLTLMVSGTLTCCFDYDGMVMDDKEESSDDFSLAFDIALNMVPGSVTRADHSNEYGDDVDNEVDDFRILLFDKDDNFLFEPQRAYYQYELEDLDKSDYESTGVQTRHWRVVIPGSALKRDGVLDEIKANSFKIAVLANWPKDKPVTFQKNDKLQKLSHYWEDRVYGNTDNSNAYGFLTKDGTMGAYTEWVNSTYGDAESAIRTEQRTDPHTITRKIGDATFPHTYKHIWRVWHFGEIGAEVNELSEISSIVDYWKEQFKKDQETLIYGNINKLEDYGGLTYHGEGQTDDCGLSLEGGEGCSYNEEGLTIGKGIFETKEKNVTYLTGNRLMFNAFAAGTIWICAKNASDEPCSLYVQLKDNNSSNNDTNRKLIAELKPGEDFKIYKYSSNISVTGAGSSDENAKLTIPEVVSVYAVGGPMIIKQIEYMEDRHLSDTDREGFLPGENNGQLIPMYGVQEFTAVGGYLTEGEILNLSGEGSKHYPHKKIHLLRSLAKVELHIPIDFPELKHAYLRCANRTSRCEPVDVVTPTDKLWENIDQEIKDIKSYGPFYGSPDTYEKYSDRLSWFYLTWVNDWKDSEKWFTPLTNYPGVGGQEHAGNYPHIFNTRINRSDYIHFRKVPSTKTFYNRYVLYVPEKNIDDPNTAGDLTKTPKIPHIELRFEGKNDDENLDDNDCYRIYFTDRNDLIDSRSTKYDDIEYKVDGNILSRNILYPIVRNHIYRFTISNFEKNIYCTVSAWDEKSTDIEFK